MPCHHGVVSCANKPINDEQARELQRLLIKGFNKPVRELYMQFTGNCVVCTGNVIDTVKWHCHRAPGRDIKAVVINSWR